MPLEVANNITQLDRTSPRRAELVSEGDDHIRLIKSVLLAAFPNIDGAVTVTPAELNQLATLTENVASALSGLRAADTTLGNRITTEVNNIQSFPSGTQMVFYQAAAPTGWTRQSGDELNNAMLRVVNNDTDGGSSGGSDSAISWSHAHATEPHTLTLAEIPTHSHRVTTDSVGVGSASAGNTNNPQATTSVTFPQRSFESTSTGGGAAHSHGSTATAEWNPKYISVIVASKD